jgi:hypothetical protein
MILSFSLQLQKTQTALKNSSPDTHAPMYATPADAALTPRITEAILQR